MGNQVSKGVTGNIGNVKVAVATTHLQTILEDEDLVQLIGLFLMGQFPHPYKNPSNKEYQEVAKPMLVCRAWRDAFGLALAQFRWDYIHGEMQSYVQGTHLYSPEMVFKRVTYVPARCILSNQPFLQFNVPNRIPEQGVIVFELYECIHNFVTYAAYNQLIRGRQNECLEWSTSFHLIPPRPLLWTTATRNPVWVKNNIVYDRNVRQVRYLSVDGKKAYYQEHSTSSNNDESESTSLWSRIEPRPRRDELLDPVELTNAKPAPMPRDPIFGMEHPHLGMTIKAKLAHLSGIDHCKNFMKEYLIPALGPRPTLRV